MTKNNQILSGKVVEATPASPSTGNPELNSYVAFFIFKNRILKTCWMLANICSSSIHRSTLLCVQRNNQNTSLVPSTDKEQIATRPVKLTVSKSCAVCPVPCAVEGQLKSSRRHSMAQGAVLQRADTAWGELAVFGEFTLVCCGAAGVEPSACTQGHRVTSTGQGQVAMLPTWAGALGHMWGSLGTQPCPELWPGAQGCSCALFPPSLTLRGNSCSGGAGAGLAGRWGQLGMAGTRTCQLCLPEVATTERMGHHRLLQTLLPSGTGQLVPHNGCL